MLMEIVWQMTAAERQLDPVGRSPARFRLLCDQKFNFQPRPQPRRSD